LLNQTSDKQLFDVSSQDKTSPLASTNQFFNQHCASTNTIDPEHNNYDNNIPSAKVVNTWSIESLDQGPSFRVKKGKFNSSSKGRKPFTTKNIISQSSQASMH
jgi:hypothetical protein